jgi:hypothetical protein
MRRKRKTVETWKPIPDYEGVYEASDLGRIRRVGGKVLSANPKNQHGHLAVTMCKDGKQKYLYVHHLVLAAFVGPRPEGMLGLHGPGGTEDNSISNLRYGTRAENSADMFAFGNPNPARKTKLSDDDVQQIRSMEGTTREIARRFNIDHGYVARLKRGEYR